MPPAINTESDSDLDTEEAAATKMSRTKNAKPTNRLPLKPSDHGSEEEEDEDQSENNVENGYEEGDEDDEEEYMVEAVLSHEVVKGTIVYEVKWQGYDNASDNTWEPEENLEGAMDILNEYFDSIGGRPTGRGRPKAQKPSFKRGRKSTINADTPNPPSKKMKAEVPVRRGRPSKSSAKSEVLDEKMEWPRTNDSWAPPKVAKDSWEEKILSLDAIIQDEDGSGQLWAYVKWVELDDDGNSRNSRVLLESVHKAAPQAAIKFYGSHLTFVNDKKPRYI